MTEQQLQSTCVRWLWNQHPETRRHFFAINNNSEHVARGMNRKAIGTVAGVSDTIFLWKGKSYLIEFKTEKGRQSTAQTGWGAKMELHGFDYFIVRSLDDFQKIMFNIL